MNVLSLLLSKEIMKEVIPFRKGGDSFSHSVINLKNNYNIGSIKSLNLFKP